MKIIGDCGDAWIVRAGKGEVSNLLGGDYATSEQAAHLKVGSDVMVCEAWHRIRSMDRHGDSLRDVQEKLRRMAADLEPVKLVLQHAVTPA